MKLDPSVIGILRGISADFFGQLMDAAFEAGLQAIEVTLNTAQAETMIAAQRSRVPEGNLLGMGTIRNLEEAKQEQLADLKAPASKDEILQELRQTQEALQRLQRKLDQE